MGPICQELIEFMWDFFAEIGGSVGIYPCTSFSDHAPVVLQVNDGKKRKQQGMIRIPSELFTKPLITDQVMYIWRQTLLQTTNSLKPDLEYISIVSL